MRNQKVPDYLSTDYCTPRRMLSYGYQVKEACEMKANELLEIGIGNGLVSHILHSFGIQSRTFDIDPKLAPDVVGSVLDMPFLDRSFDTVLCYEVLEHLPFEDFPKALSEIARVTRKSAVLSLPDVTKQYRVELKFPLPRIRVKWAKDFWWKPRPHVYNGQHHWEIGKLGYPVMKILRQIKEAGFECRRHYRIWEYPYHHFFILRKIPKGPSS